MSFSGYLLQIISLLGGLALFLFGMDVMGKALERLAGGKLQTVLAKMSSTVLRGFFLGAAVTAVIQSSSATLSWPHPAATFGTSRAFPPGWV